MNVNEILRQIEALEDTVDAEGLFGYCVTESIDPYCDASEGIWWLLHEHPENYEIYNSMLIALTGFGFETMLEIMKEKKDFYVNL